MEGIITQEIKIFEEWRKGGRKANTLYSSSFIKRHEQVLSNKLKIRIIRVLAVNAYLKIMLLSILESLS